MWYHDVVGDGRCPIVDTWWQTETGGIMITPLPGRDAAQARLGDAALLRRRAASSSTSEGKMLEGADRGQPLPRATLARA